MKKAPKERLSLKQSETDISPEAGADKPRRKNDRRCIASGVSLCAGDPAIRFVLGPDGVVVPDLAEKLPGRGAWITADRLLLEKAAAKGAFSRAFKTGIQMPEDGVTALVETVRAGLAARTLNALGLARRAGVLLTGFEKSRAAVQKGTAAAYIYASDASADGVSKILSAAKGQLAAWHLFPGSDLDDAIGEINVVHIVITDAGHARRFGREAARYRAFIAADGVSTGEAP